MKELHNIFSKKPVKQKEQNKYPIVVDTREKQSLIAANLMELKATVSFEKLEVGDYLVADTTIERKTFSDFVSSILNKRLLKQLRDLKQIKSRLVIIEGFDYNYAKHSIHENAIRGMLLSIAQDYETPIIFSKDEKDTAKFLLVLAKRKEKVVTASSKRHAKKTTTLEEQKQFILEGFPGIGPKIAKSLLEQHKTLSAIFKLSEKELALIEKFDDKKIKEFKKILED